MELREIVHSLMYINERRIMQLRYEDMLNAPMEVLSSILGFLGLPVDDNFLKAADSLRLSTREHVWKGQWNEMELRTVMSEAEPLLREFDYIDGQDKN